MPKTSLPLCQPSLTSSSSLSAKVLATASIGKSWPKGCSLPFHPVLRGGQSACRPCTAPVTLQQPVSPPTQILLHQSLRAILLRQKKLPLTSSHSAFPSSNSLSFNLSLSTSLGPQVPWHPITVTVSAALHKYQAKCTSGCSCS